MIFWKFRVPSNTFKRRPIYTLYIADCLCSPVQPWEWWSTNFLKLIKAALPWHLYGSIPSYIPLEFHSDSLRTPGEIRGRGNGREGRHGHWWKGGKMLPGAGPALVLLPPHHPKECEQTWIWEPFCWQLRNFMRVICLNKHRGLDCKEVAIEGFPWQTVNRRCWIGTRVLKQILGLGAERTQGRHILMFRMVGL